MGWLTLFTDLVDGASSSQQASSVGRGLVDAARFCPDPGSGRVVGEQASIWFALASTWRGMGL